MIIQLLSRDIPRYWEVIKFAVMEIGEVDKENMPAYLRELLIALLSEKAQCWVRVDDGQIVFIFITRVLYNAMQDEKYLYVQIGYSWKRLPEEVWNKDLGMFMQFARQEDCKYIGTMSRNPRIWEICQNAGFSEITRTFAYRVPK